MHTFRITDDEVSRLHGPLIAFSLIDLVAASSPSAPRSDDALMAITIAHALLKESASSIFASVSDDSLGAVTTAAIGMQTAVSFYSATYDKSARIPASGFAHKLLLAAFGTLLSLISQVRLADSPNHELLVALLQLLAFMTELAPPEGSIPLKSSISAWSADMAALIAGLQILPGNFELLDSTVSCLFALNRVVEPRASMAIDQEAILSLADTVSQRLQL